MWRFDLITFYLCRYTSVLELSAEWKTLLGFNLVNSSEPWAAGGSVEVTAAFEHDSSDDEEFGELGQGKLQSWWVSGRNAGMIQGLSARRDLVCWWRVKVCGLGLSRPANRPLRCNFHSCSGWLSASSMCFRFGISLHSIIRWERVS